MPLIGDISGSGGKASVIGVTGSVIFAGADPDFDIAFPYVGSDVAFYVSGSTGGANHADDQGVAVFGGDTIISGVLAVGSSNPASTALTVNANVDGSFAAVIDNDQSSNGHVLRLLTDGNGSGTTIMQMDDGDGDVVFKARADGRFGFGPSGVSSMGAGTFVVGIDGGHTSDIAISKRLQHLGDSDTYMDFTAADQIEFVVGNVDMIHMTEDGSQDMIVFNEGGADVDFRVESDNKTHAFFVNAGDDVVNIGADEGAHDSFCFISGAIHGREAEGGIGRNTLVVGGDTIISGALLVGGDNFHPLVGDDVGGTISGSIHMTSGGLSYIVGGDGMTVTSASNGQITLAGGGARSVSGDTDNGIVSWVTSNNTFAVESNLTFDGTDLGVSAKVFHVGDTDTYIDFTDDDINIQAGGVDFIKITEDGSQDTVIFNEGGADVDFRVESNNKTHALFVHGEHDAVIINDSAEPGEDVSFYVSGTTDLKDTGAVRGVSVFGGDLVVSGVIYGGYDDDTSAPFLELAANTTVITSKAGAEDVTTGGDTLLFVSGHIGSINTSIGGVAVFGGDVVGSGSIVAQDLAAGDDLTVGDDATIMGDILAAEYIKHHSDADTYIRFQADDINIQAGGVDFIKITEDDSQDLIEFNVAEADVDFIVNNNADEVIRVDTTGIVFNEDSHANIDFRIESNNKTHTFFVNSGDDVVNIGSETGAHDSFCFISGTIMGRAAEGGDGLGALVVGGDTIISGALLVGGDDFHEKTEDWVGGTISGSIHVTSGGIPYIVGGANITVTSASSGQITIAGAAGSGGSTSPGGSDGFIQFNDDDSFGAVDSLKYIENAKLLKIGADQHRVIISGSYGTQVTGSFHISGSSDELSNAGRLLIQTASAGYDLYMNPGQAMAIKRKPMVGIFENSTSVTPSELAVFHGAAQANFMGMMVMDNGSTVSLMRRLPGGSNQSGAVSGSINGMSPGRGSQLGTMVFGGWDGHRYIQGAAIEANVTGSAVGGHDIVAEGHMPTRLDFKTLSGSSGAPTRRMSIGTNGGVSIGANAQPSIFGDGSLVVSNVATFQASVSGQAALQISNTQGSNAAIGMDVMAGSNSPGSAGDCVYINFIQGNGSSGGGVMCGSTTANPEFFNGSDERVKRDIAPTQIDGLGILNSLDLVEYRWLPNYVEYDGLNRIGFIAQNCEEVYPEMVTDMPHKNFDHDIKSVAQAELIPVLVKAVQELSAEVNSLKAKISKLESE